MSRRRFKLGDFLRFALQGAVLTSLGGAAVVVLTAQPDTWSHVWELEWLFLPLLAAMVAGAWLANAGRLWVWTNALGHPLRPHQCLALVLSTEFGVAASPGGLGGQVVRVALLRQAGMPLPVGISLAAADVVADLLFFALLVPLALLLWSTDPLWRELSVQARPGTLTSIGVSLGALALTAYAVWRSGLFSRLVGALLRRSRRARAARLPGRYRWLRWALRRNLRRVWQTLAFLWHERRRSLVAVVGLAAVQWLCRYGVLPVILLGFGTLHNPLPLVVLQGFLLFFAMLVVLPGGGGGVEFLSALILPLFVAQPLIGLVVLLWRFFTYHLYLLIGGAVFFQVCRNPRAVFPETASTGEMEFEVERPAPTPRLRRRTRLPWAKSTESTPPSPPKSPSSPPVK